MRPIPKQEARIKFNTEAISEMSEIMVSEIQQIGLGGEGMRRLERYLLFRVSDNTLRKETEGFGELQQAQEAQRVRNRQDEKWLQQRQREIQ